MAKPGEKIGDHKVLVNLPPPLEKGDARDQAAKIVGVSGAMIDRAKTVEDKGAPELQDAVARGEITVTVAKELTALTPEKQIEVELILTDCIL